MAQVLQIRPSKSITADLIQPIPSNTNVPDSASLEEYTAYGQQQEENDRCKNKDTTSEPETIIPHQSQTDVAIENHHSEMNLKPL